MAPGETTKVYELTGDSLRQLVDSEAPDTVKETLKRVLRAVEAARADGLSIDVSGMDEFDIGEFSTELDDAKKLLELGIQSDTLKNQLFKRLVAKYFCDLSQDVKNNIANEIDRSFDSAAAK